MKALVLAPQELLDPWSKEDIGLFMLAEED